MSRTLAGHLEDLDLEEVVKVIALSRRSGVLVLESDEGNADLTFLNGRIISVRLSTQSTPVGNLLVDAGILTRNEIAMASDSDTIDDILRRSPNDSNASNATADQVLLEHMRNVVLKTLLFRSGPFSFQMTEPGPPPARFPRDTSITVAAGLDAEDLIREAKRRRQGRARDPMANIQHQSGLPRSAEDSAMDLIVVDDNAPFLESVERRAVAAGVSTLSLSDARSAIERLEDLNSDGPSAMVVDLVMPRSNGRGFLGGLEVLKRAFEEGVAGSVFLAMEQEHADAIALARTLGAAGVLHKPADASEINDLLNPVLEHLGRTPVVGSPIDLIGELRKELGEGDASWHDEPEIRVDDSTRSLEVLKSLLGELNDPSFEEEIPLLVLRFASAFFARGALFYVDSDSGQLVGLGGFGLGPGDAGRTIHAVRIPTSADTVFTRAIRERSGVRQPYFDSEWNARFQSAMGGPKPSEVYTAPLSSPRGIEAVVYADNATDPRAFPDIALFEIFLQQAGAAIERSDLARQVKALVAGGSQIPVEAVPAKVVTTETGVDVTSADLAHASMEGAPVES